MTNKFQLIRLYFNADKICLGGVDNDWWQKDFDGDYWASDYFWLPIGYNPIGKHGDELLQFLKPPANAQLQRRVLKSHPIPARSATAPGEITLREWHPNGEWATHFHNLQDGGYYYGRYFRNLTAAEADFDRRVKEETDTKTLPDSPTPIEVPAAVLQGIEAVRALATANMFDARIVGAQAIALGHVETALWIEANTETYYGGMMRGFATCEPDSV